MNSSKTCRNVQRHSEVLVVAFEVPGDEAALEGRVGLLVELHLARVDELIGPADFRHVVEEALGHVDLGAGTETRVLGSFRTAF